jgi:hypothetical protein
MLARSFWVLYLAPSICLATTFILKTEEEKILESQRICAVKVIKIENRSEQNLVMTYATVEPLECFKDSTNQNFEVVWPGGTLHTKDAQGKPLLRRSLIPGTPQLKLNETYLLYLWRSNPQGPFTVHGWTQGVVDLSWDSKTKSYLMGAEAKGLQKRKLRAQTATQELPTLKGFREKVNRVLKTQKP